MTRPNVAMSSSIGEEGMLSIRDTYLKAVWKAGGMPSLLYSCSDYGYINETINSFDGFVFCGGGDIDPKFYREENKGQSKNICSLRDGFEYRLFIAAYLSKKPILGICRGMQIINVFLGGSLYQHINGHIQKEKRDVATQCVHVKKGSLLADIISANRVTVNSFHHQAIKALADGLYIDSMSSDGYIEAYHLEGHNFLLGIQWHPEALFDRDESSKRIFEAFINACRH